MIQDPLLQLGRAGAAAAAGRRAADRLQLHDRARALDNLELPLSPSAEFFPFAYSVDERFDLEHYLRPHHDDPDGELTAWARQFIRTDGPTGTRDLLVRMNQHIRDKLRLRRARRGRHADSRWRR